MEWKDAWAAIRNALTPIKAWVLESVAGAAIVGLIAKLYSDSKLRNGINLRGQREGQFPTLRLERQYGIPHVVLNLEVDNRSSYSRIVFGHMNLVIADSVRFTHDAEADGPVPRLVIIRNVSEQEESRLKALSASPLSPTVVISGTAVAICGSRRVTVPIHIEATIHVAT